MSISLSEESIEELIYNYPWLLDERFVVARVAGNRGSGRQVNVGREGMNRFIDLLFKDTRDGRPVIVELKKTKLIRDNIAQILEYRGLITSMDGSHRSEWESEFGINYFAPKMILVGEEAPEEVLVSANLAGISVRLFTSPEDKEISLSSVETIRSKLQEWDDFLESGNQTLSVRDEWVENIFNQVLSAIEEYGNPTVHTVKRVPRTTDRNAYITELTYPFINIPIYVEDEHLLGLYEYYDEQSPFSQKHIYCDVRYGTLNMTDEESGELRADAAEILSYFHERGYTTHDTVDGCVTVLISREILRNKEGLQSYIKRLLHDALELPM